MRTLAEQLQEKFPVADGFSVTSGHAETTLEAPEAHLLETLRCLRDDFRFNQLIDITGADYSTLAGHDKPRFAAIYHLLSLPDNRRLRVRAFCPDDELPRLPSVTGLWRSANWYEREAFDLFGIIFVGHEDLRRLLTDYGFVGHPFRKDFPLSGHVEMRYDPVEKRVIYQPVSIEPREVTPRTIREETFGKE